MSDPTCEASEPEGSYPEDPLAGIDLDLRERQIQATSPDVLYLAIERNAYLALLRAARERDELRKLMREAYGGGSKMFCACTDAARRGCGPGEPWGDGGGADVSDAREEWIVEVLDDDGHVIEIAEDFLGWTKEEAFWTQGAHPQEGEAMTGKKRAAMFRIKSDANGTYYVGPSPIGPRFGGSRGEAATFEDGWDAYRAMRGFPMTVLATLVNEKDQPCDVTGKRLSQ